MKKTITFFIGLTIIACIIWTSYFYIIVDNAINYTKKIKLESIYPFLIIDPALDENINNKFNTFSQLGINTHTGIYDALSSNKYIEALTISAEEKLDDSSVVTISYSTEGYQVNMPFLIANKKFIRFKHTPKPFLIKPLEITCIKSGNAISVSSYSDMKEILVAAYSDKDHGLYLKRSIERNCFFKSVANQSGLFNLNSINNKLQIKENFISSCISQGANKDICSCVFKYLSNRKNPGKDTDHRYEYYSLEEFPKDMKNAAKTCAHQPKFITKPAISLTTIAETNHGNLQVDENQKLYHNGKLFKPEISSSMSLTAEKHFRLDQEDIVIIFNNTGGTGCHGFYHIISLSAAGTKASEWFGNCFEASQFEQSKNTIFITIPIPFGDNEKEVYKYSDNRLVKIPSSN